MRIFRDDGPGTAGFGLVELLLALVIVALLGSLAYNAYLGSTRRTLERFHQDRPLSQARLATDRATLAAMRSALQLHYAQHGRWPADKDAVAALMNPPPRLQCPGNDFTYDPPSGRVALLIDDPARCP
jgi:prepilin-type N-terminal cleavage/methylation domain-containing protein